MKNNKKPLGQQLRDIKSKGRYLKGESATSRKAQLYALGYNLFDDNDFNNNIDNSSDDKDDKKIENDFFLVLY